MKHFAFTLNCPLTTFSALPGKYPALGLAVILTGLCLASPVVADDHDHDHAHEHNDHADEAEGHAHDEHDHDDEHHDHDEERVTLAPEVMAEFGLELAEAGPGVVHEGVVLPGEIQFSREHVAYVTPRFNGTVVEIKARLADPVSKGQVLAVLESTDTLRPFELRAPLDGVITDYDIAPGEAVEAGTALFTVADLSTVWADLRIYQRDLGRVALGQEVVITGGHGGNPFPGTIAYIAPVIDEHTRTGLARVVVDNEASRWKPGQFIKGSVSVDRHRAEVVVPRSAVLDYEGQPVVFVRTDEGFEPRPVLLGPGDDEFLSVESGLEPGETYVARNPISLKAELGKGSFGGHQH